jgi:glycosyltransferase involved in cell wall biosynthesis
MKKILFVVNDAAFFISHRLPIAQKLINEGNDVHLATSGEALSIYDELGLSFHKLEVSRRGTSPINEFRLILKLFKLCSGLKPDLVHLVTIKPYLYGGIVAKITKVPAVVSAVSGLGFVAMSKGIKIKLLRAMLFPLYKFSFSHKNQIVIFQNSDDAKFLVNWGVLNSAKIRLIRGSGVDLDVYQYVPEPEGKVTVTFVARLLTDKGIREFIEVSRIFLGKDKDVSFCVAGDLDLDIPQSITEAEMKSWKTYPNVNFLGFHRNIADLYSKSNIVCLPSYREGLPKSLAEAAACGRAVVTTNVPGCRDAIKPDKTGLLVPVKNAKALSDAIDYLVDNPDVRKRMGAAGRALAESDYKIQKVVTDHINIYDELFDQKPLLCGRLLFVVNVDWFFISHRLPIALEAMRQGYEVHIATGLTDKLSLLQGYGFVVHPLSLNRSGVSLQVIGKTFWQILCVCKKVKPDLVHFVTIKPVLLGGLAARIVGIPAVVSAVSGLGFVFVAEGIKAVIRRWVVKHLYRAALGHHNQKIIFQNNDDLSRLAGLVELPGQKLSLIRGSGADLSQYNVTQLPSGVPIVMLAARLLVDKGVREFVQSAKILRRRGLSERDVRFVIVGKPDPDNPHSLHQEELFQWSEEGVVELWGHRTDMPQVIASAHIVVLPSYYGEGLPKVLIEAAACGRVVVTTDHPGCRDAIQSEVTGILVPVRDTKALANSIQELLDDPVRCVTMGKAGRQLAESAFDEKHVVGAHIKIYQELIDGA